jgi:hypothetical protein
VGLHGSDEATPLDCPAGALSFRCDRDERRPAVNNSRNKYAETSLMTSDQLALRIRRTPSHHRSLTAAPTILPKAAPARSPLSTARLRPPAHRRHAIRWQKAIAPNTKRSCPSDGVVCWPVSQRVGSVKTTIRRWSSRLPWSECSTRRRIAAAVIRSVLYPGPGAINRCPKRKLPKRCSCSI